MNNRNLKRIARIIGLGFLSAVLIGAYSSTTPALQVCIAFVLVMSWYNIIHDELRADVALRNHATLRANDEVQDNAVPRVDTMTRDSASSASTETLADAELHNDTSRIGTGTLGDVEPLDDTSQAGTETLSNTTTHEDADLPDEAELQDGTAYRSDTPNTGELIQRTLFDSLPLFENSPSTQIPEIENDLAPFDFAKFSRTICTASNPVEELRLCVEDIRAREKNDGVDVVGQSRGLPSGLELFVARALEESQALDEDAHMPLIGIIQLRRTSLFYVRVLQPRLSYASKLRVMRLENALNRIGFAADFCEAQRDGAGSLEEEPDIRFEDAYLLNQQLEQAICSQIPQMLPDADGINNGEWDARMMLGAGIEAFQLPYRLTADYRMNLRDRVAAISINLAPPEVFPASAYIPNIKRVVPTTKNMRRRAATDYALRLGILLAAFSFRCASKLNEVYVCGIVDDGLHHNCLYSVCFDRTRFSAIDLEHLDSLPWHYRCFGANIRIQDGMLRPITPTFSLNDERFCPPERYDPIELSPLLLNMRATEALGTTLASELGINEDARRRYVADKITRLLTSSTEKNVRTILDVAEKDNDLSVKSAATRTIQKLIDGTLDDGDGYAFHQEFVDGDELTVAMGKGVEYLLHNNAEKALRVIEPVLHDIDTSGRYTDNDFVEHRSFNSYADRTLYNLTYKPVRTVKLVPDAYYEAHVLASVAHMALNHIDAAMSYARRALEINPLDAGSRLQITRCLEMEGDFEGAVQVLQEMITSAHNPEGVGLAYYRMAFMQLQLNHPLVAEACYRKSMEFPFSARPMARIELMALKATQMLSGASEDEDSEDEEQNQEMADMLESMALYVPDNLDELDPGDIAAFVSEDGAMFTPDDIAAFVSEDGATFVPLDGAVVSALDDMDSDDVDTILNNAGIGLVDVEAICNTAYTCGKAAMEIGAFPVARSFAHILASFSGDDAVFNLVRSIEKEPDR